MCTDWNRFWSHMPVILIGWNFSAPKRRPVTVSQEPVLGCDSVALLFGKWKGQAQQSEHQQRGFFNLMWKCLHFQKPDLELWRWQTVQGFKPINLIQRWVVKLANLSDVRLIGKSWLSAGAENWRLAQDWFARIWLQVNNFLHQRFLYKYQISRKLKQKQLLSHHLVLCWRRRPFKISSSLFQDVFSGFIFLRNVFIQ